MPEERTSSVQEAGAPASLSSTDQSIGGNIVIVSAIVCASTIFITGWFSGAPSPQATGGWSDDPDLMRDMVSWEARDCTFAIVDVNWALVGKPGKKGLIN